MAKTAVEVAALKSEIQSWLAEHQLTHDAGWRELTEKEKSAYENPADIPYLTLWFEGPLYEVFYPLTENEETRTWIRTRREEFDALVDKHECWYDFEDPTTINIMDNETIS